MAPIQMPPVLVADETVALHPYDTVCTVSIPMVDLSRSWVQLFDVTPASHRGLISIRLDQEWQVKIERPMNICAVRTTVRFQVWGHRKTAPVAHIEVTHASLGGTVRAEECAECFGTGFWKGFGAPCSKRCGRPSEDVEIFRI